MENTLFQEYLENAFKDVKWQSNQTKKWKIIFFGALALLISSIIITIILGFTVLKLEQMFYLFGLFFLIFIFTVIVGISGTIWLFKHRSNQSSVLSYIPKDIYEKYYELTYPNNVLKFNGFYRSTIYRGRLGFSFEINGEKIWWDVQEHSETRRHDDEKETVYILDYFLRLESKNLIGYDEPIALTANSKLINLFNLNNNRYQFFSPSISFNKKFKVTGNNELQMTRLFDPSVIDYFDQMNDSYLDLYKNHMIQIENSNAFTKWQSGDANLPWAANLNDFNYLFLTKKNYLNTINKKIEEDFNRFFIAFNLFRPFDFYRIYQGKTLK